MMSARSFRVGLVWPTMALGLVFSIGSLTSLAAADDSVDKANSFFAGVVDTKRSDLVLLPVLAKMEEPPAGVATVRRAMMVSTDSPAWAAASRWVQGASQRAVLDALNQITAEEDYRDAMVFAQAYGAEGVQIDAIQSGLYTELGDPPLLAVARHGYLPAMENMECLVHVESTRLASSGDPGAAIDLLVDWIYFGRQLADREFVEEVLKGYEAMLGGFERIRDIAYQDVRASSSRLTAEKIIEIQSRLDPKGYLAISRLRLPRGNIIASDQIVAITRDSRGDLKRGAFVSTMSRLGTTDRPLRLFSEAARWDQLADATDDFSLDDSVGFNAMYDDWRSKWGLDPFDDRMSLVWFYDQINELMAISAPDLVGVVKSLLPDHRPLFDKRRLLDVEAVGTRTSLAMAAFVIEHRNFPRVVQAIRPQYAKVIEGDPFNPQERDREGSVPLYYFVPIRDTASDEPHVINVFDEAGNFRIPIRDDQFVLYSVGPDGAKGWAKEVQNTAELAPGADYLIWPPVISLRRDFERLGRQ